MLGVVGKLKVEYCVGNTRYDEIIDVANVKEFHLEGASEVVFIVEEIRYIEDTIYYVALSSCKLCQLEDNEIVVDGKGVQFDIPETCIRGNMRLVFLS